MDGWPESGHTRNHNAGATAGAAREDANRPPTARQRRAHAFLFHPDCNRRPWPRTRSADPDRTWARPGARGLLQSGCRYRRWGISPRPENAARLWIAPHAGTGIVGGAQRRARHWAPAVVTSAVRASDRSTGRRGAACVIAGPISRTLRRIPFAAVRRSAHQHAVTGSSSPRRSGHSRSLTGTCGHLRVATERC
jgi:hypothetical protein